MRFGACTHPWLERARTAGRSAQPQDSRGSAQLFANTNRQGDRTMLEQRITVGAALMATALALSAIPSAALAQSNVFSVNYYANANTGGPDATVRITNPGTAGAPSPSGDLCALIYVFSADQQMAECCG